MMKFFSVCGVIAAFMMLGTGIYGYLNGKSGYADWLVGSVLVAAISGLFYGMNTKGND